LAIVAILGLTTWRPGALELRAAPQDAIRVDSEAPAPPSPPNPSGDCPILSNTCGIPYYVWSLPGTVNSRLRMAEGFVLDTSGALRECTLKTVWIMLYDWIDTSAKVDVDVTVYADDGAKLPGTPLVTVTLPSALVDTSFMTWLEIDFSSYNLTAPPESRLHVALEVPSATPGSNGVYLLSDAGEDEPFNCPEGATNLNGSVFYANVGHWESHFTDFVFRFGTFIQVQTCCPPLEFMLCTPGSAAHWASQGNGPDRTNATTASISNLCGLTRAWSVEPGGLIQAIQPICVGERILVTATDSIHCYDKASGTQLWALGGAPYIEGDLRASPTVDLSDPGPGGEGVIYVGGADAESFNKLDLATGGVIWSRNKLAGDPPYAPLDTGTTAWSPPVVADGFVFFAQRAFLHKLDAATGVSATGSPLKLPDVWATGAAAYNAMTSNGSKLWVGTADAIGTAGAIFQVDMATMSLDWLLSAPGNSFYPEGIGDSDFDPYSPEGFPGAMAFDNGILYYHSQIRNDGNGFAHYPQSGSIGAIDVATEDGTGAGILWVNNAHVTTVSSPGLTAGYTRGGTFSGPALGYGLVYLTSHGIFGGLVEQDGVSAWVKSVGVRVWYAGYTHRGTEHGIERYDDVRSDAPATVICQPDGTPYLFTGHGGGMWRLYHGNTGAMMWERTLTGRVRGTAITDDCVATVVRDGDPATGGGALVVFTPGVDRPRLQIDSLFVFRTIAPGTALSDDINGALRNTGCADLNIAAYVPTTSAPHLISSAHPALVASAARASSELDGYDSWFEATSDDNGIDLARAFSDLATADPLFITVNTSPGTLPPGERQTLNVTYDASALAANGYYTNHIQIATNDPDHYPQDPSGALLGDPFITFTLFVGCPDEATYISSPIGEAWISNFGATGFGDGNGFHVNGNDWYYDGGWALVVQDSAHWAFDGCSVGDYPRRAGEFAPAEPCGLTVITSTHDSPLGPSQDTVQEIAFGMIDLGSTHGFFPPGTRQCGGVLIHIRHVLSQDIDFGDFALTAITITNEAGAPGDIPGEMRDVYFAALTDWNLGAVTDNHTELYDNGSYACFDGGTRWKAGANHFAGHMRIDAAAFPGSGRLSSVGAPAFLMADIQDDQRHGHNAFRMLSDPVRYYQWIDMGLGYVIVDNTDIGAIISFTHIPVLADGASETFYVAVYQVDNGLNGLPWSDAAGFDRSVVEIQQRAKAFAGFGKGDVNCDGVIDLTDMILLGNILDGLFDPAGTGGVYSADVDADNDWDEADYDLLWDVVTGVTDAGALANGWRF
jgi:hypothetical protein